MSNIRNFFRRFVVRSVAAWAFSFVVSPVGVAQQITCPVATSTTNTSTTAGNSLNCQIDSGVTFTNKATAQLTNFTGAVLVNEGTLTNNGGFFNLVGATLTNAGTFNGTGQAQNYGAINNVAGGTLTNAKVLDNNAGGTINNDPGATIFNADVLNNAGSFNNNAGQAILLSGSMLNNDSGATLTNSGGFQINGGATLLSGGTITNISGATFTNNGALNAVFFDNYGAVTNGSGGTISTQGANPELENHSGSTLVNYGKITNFGNLISDSGASLTTYGEILNAQFLSNAGSLEIKSGGSIFNESGTSATNTGTLLIDSGGFVTSFSAQVLNSGTLMINGTYMNEEGGSLTNAGTLILNAGAELENDFSGGTIINAGTLNIRAGATLTDQNLNDTYLQTHGQTIVDGTLNTAKPLQIEGGVLSGTGKIVGSVLNIGGTVQPGDNGAPGILLMEGYEQQSGAIFDELIGASGNGELVAVPGGVLLDPGALLDIDLLNGFTPTDGETFDIMGAIGISGTFANAPATGFEMDGFDWTITYDPGEIVLDAVSPVSGGTAPTPEPSSVLLLAFGYLAVAGYSRRKRAALAD
jgi:fibronectin-binding autotransporter adhesin